MTGHHTRHIVLTVLATVVLSAPVDAQEAHAALLARAEQGGDAEEQYAIGFAYQNGRGGLPQDYAEAARWYRLAAEQGSVEAQYGLGRMYRIGEGVPEDDAEAARFYRLAAEQGHVLAQVNLGVSYATGEGVLQDYVEAVRWYRMAAEQGDAEAQFLLGFYYSTGEGLPQDYAEAVRWLRLAAEQGHAEAQFLLAKKYRFGEGVPQDYVQSHMWVNLAASRLTGETREAAVEARDNVAQIMTPEQIAEAQRLAREWEAAHPREP
jgi:hypothetical protein